MPRNPLMGIEKVKTKEGQTAEVPALGPDGMQRLLSMAQERKLVYLMAAHTGLRRSELAAQIWRDFHFEGKFPFVRVRAATTKNGKAVEMRLHPELAEELQKIKYCGVPEDNLVFKSISRIERFRRDLIKTGISLKDAFGRKPVFHSLRHTFGTSMAPALDGQDLYG